MIGEERRETEKWNEERWSGKAEERGEMEGREG